MRKLIVLTAGVLFLGMGVRGFAQSDEEATSDWEVGTEVSHITYDEPNVMEEEGMMDGLLGAYTYRDRIMLKGEARGSWGQVDYSNSGTMDDVDDYMLELRGLAGYDFPVGEATTATPYAGLGYRYLNDDLTGTTSTGAIGYERESNYYYSPIGVTTDTEFNNEWSGGLTLEYDYFWKGIQKSHLSDAVSGFADLENDQNDGYGCRASVHLTKKGENVDFIIEPFIRYWNIKKSEEENITYGGVVVGYGYEPKNNSTEFGLRLAAKF